jgi:hypothetical protein
VFVTRRCLFTVAPCSSIHSSASFSFFKNPITMPRLVSSAEHLSSRSDSCSSPCPAARRAREVLSASALAFGARKSRSSFGCKTKTAPTRTSGHKAKSSSHVSGCKVKPALSRSSSCKAKSASSRASSQSLAQSLCLCCAKFTETELEHYCFFDKDSLIMYFRCQTLKSPYNPVSEPIFVAIPVLIWYRFLPI